MTNKKNTGVTNFDEVIYRQGTLNDSYAVFCLFEEAYADLMKRMGFTGPTSFSNPKALKRMWEHRRSLYHHLALTAESYLLAEANGEIIGIARSIQEDNVCQLTEFFVKPDLQSAGVGKELLERAFLCTGAHVRTILSTSDVRALARYLKAGLTPRFPVAYFGREVMAAQAESDLVVQPISIESHDLETFGSIDEKIIGFRRDQTHRWLLTDRKGYLYIRGGTIVGYGYVGKTSGPFAVLDAELFPYILAHAEADAKIEGIKYFGVEVPLINRVTVDYLLDQGFKMDGFLAHFMTDEPLGKFENYIFTSPPFFL